jgi:uncharacterized cupin superfamily protein
MSQATPTLPRKLAATRSFIDLRRFAESQGGPIAGAEAGDAYLAARHHLDLPSGPVSVGLLTLDGSEGQVDRMPGDDFIILLTGELTITSGGVQTLLTPHRSAVIPGGRSFTWRAAAGTTALFMRYDGPVGPAAALTIDEAGSLEPSNPPLAELLVGPTPRCRNRTDYRSADGEFMCGVWDSTPYHRLPMPYRHYELMHLLKGAVTFEDAAGRRATFSAGDIFLVEQGAECSWFSDVDVAKVFAIYRPA